MAAPIDIATVGGAKVSLPGIAQIGLRHFGAEVPD
jgi:hypothetical protein